MKYGKIISLDDLAQICHSLKENSRMVVYCHGCFDLLHIGHIRHLRQARQFGDVLIVTITPDRFVDKGPHRPAFNENLRAEALASLDCVDYVAVNKWADALETLRLLKPDIYAKGADYAHLEEDQSEKIALEKKIVQEIGGRMMFTRDIVFSSTQLINRFFSTFPNEVREYMALFQSRYGIKDILNLFERMSRLKVLVIGDTILDDYHFCRTLGSSTKDPVLAVQFDSNDLFAGGVLAVANHVANFAGCVRLITVLGESDSHETFIRSRLHPNINPMFAYQKNAPTTIKRRFLEGYSLNKLFEVYIMDDTGLSGEAELRYIERIKQEIAAYDLVIAADFGHGAISDRIRQTLIDHAPFLAVNTQANAGNRGFHTVATYPRADYVSIAEHEIRLEERDLRGEIMPMINRIGAKLGCEKIVVTRGKKGCMVRTKQGVIIEVPAFARKVVDRIGAGDAFFSVTGLAAYLGASPELIGFIGNLVGALAVEIVGNKKAIDMSSVKKYLESLWEHSGVPVE